MYPMNPSPMSSAPSSYGLSQPQNSMLPQQVPQPTVGATMPNAYAHGGRTKRGKLVMAHFNPKELDIMDHLQGKVEKCPRSGMRSYTHLEEILKNPHLLSSVHHHASRHAHGGPALPQHNQMPAHANYHDSSLNQMAGHGVHGDTELALIGPHTHHVFNRLAQPGTVINHQDGRPQYWSLGGTLSGLWDTIKGGAQAAAPYIGSIGKSILPSIMPAIQGAATAYGGPIGGAAAGALGGLADKGLDALSGMGSDSNRAMASTIGQGLNSAMNARQGGANMSQSLGAGLSSVGSRFGGGVGGGLQGLGAGLQQGSGYRDIAKSTALGAYNGAGGNQGALNAARGMLSQYGQGMSPRAIAMNQAQNAMQSGRQSLPSLDSMNNQDAFKELPFGGQYA